VAAGEFVAVDPRHRKRGAPELRRVFEGLREDFGEHARIDSDIGDADPAAMRPARQQQMCRLAPEERDGFAGADGHAHHRAAGAVDAARQIDAENRRAVGVDRFDHVERVALHRSVQAGAEQRVDDQRGLADRLRIERQHRIFPSPGRGRGVALQAVPLAQQDHRDLATARGQFSRRHEAVAAIVAPARDHQDRTFLDEIHRGFGHGLAGAQHQLETGRARGNADPIGTLHLRGGQDLHAKSSIQAPLPKAFPVAPTLESLKTARRLTCLPIS
jgi:hypothetical protein